MISKIHTMGLRGIGAYRIEVECSTFTLSSDFEIVGLPDAAVKEAKERVAAACENNGLKFPESSIMVNLAPANTKKEGSSFDLAILLSILTVLPRGLRSDSLSDKCFVGELSLSGELRGVKGALSMSLEAKRTGIRELYVPAENANEAAAIEGIDVYGVRNVRELIYHLTGKKPLTKVVYDSSAEKAFSSPITDFSDVKGQRKAKRAMEIAAAGGHNVLMIGPPGSGKSMLAKCLPGILPDMTFDESVETTMVHSVSLGGCPALIRNRPFRSPHHTVSAPGLIGGGANPRPGEVSLAHNGVLFLDEFPEFNRNIIDALRQPAEDGYVTVTRVSASVRYPARFMLVCAMNPCRCGYFGSSDHICTCSEDSIHKYLGKVSGPMLDRMDIQVELPSVTYAEMSDNTKSAETSAVVKERVDRARRFAKERYKREGITAENNARLTPREIRECCIMDEDAQNMMRSAFERLGLSARAHDKILKVARTIADLDGSENIKSMHIAEAIQFRSLDRKYWNR